MYTKTTTTQLLEEILKTLELLLYQNLGYPIPPRGALSFHQEFIDRLIFIRKELLKVDEVL